MSAPGSRLCFREAAGEARQLSGPSCSVRKDRGAQAGCSGARFGSLSCDQLQGRSATVPSFGHQQSILLVAISLLLVPTRFFNQLRPRVAYPAKVATSNGLAKRNNMKQSITTQRQRKEISPRARQYRFTFRKRRPPPALGRGCTCARARGSLITLEAAFARHAKSMLGYTWTPNVPLLRALWSLLDGIWGVLHGSWGVLVQSQEAQKRYTLQTQGRTCLYTDTHEERDKVTEHEKCAHMYT